MLTVISNIDMHVAANSGHTAILKANEPQELRDEVAEAALAKGAKLVVEPVTPVKVEEPAQDKTTALVTVLEKMMDEGDPKNFKADGYPKAAAVNAAAGRNVPSEEREAAWDSILNS